MPPSPGSFEHRGQNPAGSGGGFPLGRVISDPFKTLVAKIRVYLVYLKNWTLNLMPLMVHPKVHFGGNIHSLHPMFSIWF